MTAKAEPGSDANVLARPVANTTCPGLGGRLQMGGVLGKT